MEEESELQVKPKKVIGTLIYSLLETDKKAKTAVFEIGNNEPDRNGWVKNYNGVKLDNYKGTILFDHRDDTLIAKALWTKRRTKDGVLSMISKAQYAENDTAREVFWMIENEFPVAASTGLYPIEDFDGEAALLAYEEDMGMKPPKKKWTEYAGDIRWARYMRVSELLEWSNVYIPANPATWKEKSGLLSDNMKQLIMPRMLEVLNDRMDAIEARLRAGDKEIPQEKIDTAALIATITKQLKLQ